MHLLAKEAGFREGILIGFLADTHIYMNHIEGLKEQIKRAPFELPRLKTENFKSVFEWVYTDSEVINYRHHPTIRFEVAV